jgi:hypothetical protein
VPDLKLLNSERLRPILVLGVGWRILESCSQ